MTAQSAPIPRLIEREAQAYVGVRERVTMQSFAVITARIPELFGRLAERGVPPVGAPFFRYHVIDMAGQMEVEAGVPVAADVAGDAVVTRGTLPAGRYITTCHLGHPDGLLDRTTHLLQWADQRNMEWDMWQTESNQHWGCRLEVYNTNPEEQPDLHLWETDLVFRLADGPM